MFFSLSVSSQIYSLLFLISVIPVFAGFKPFTYYISKKDYPEAIAGSEKFLKINNGMSLIWGALFLLAAVAAHMARGLVWEHILPPLLLLVLGVYVNKKMPEYLASRIKTRPIEFKTVKDLMAAMPHGINRNRAKDESFTVAYSFTGNEPADYLLSVRKGECAVAETKSDADLTIICDSSLWLDIAGGKVSGDEAFMDGRIQASGDISLLAVISELMEKETPKTTYHADYRFKHAEPMGIKKVLIIDASPRGEKSKTRLMSRWFAEGAENAGAECGFVSLKDMRVHHCVGCYTCWTKTPGVCVFDDDMANILEQMKGADLIVFSSPLYYFSVCGLMKVFMDRMLPMLEPFMVKDEKGQLTHPKRYEKKQYFVVVSACGFTEIKHNFDGLLSVFRCMDRHSAGFNLMGELLLTTSEILNEPVYARKKEKIRSLCIKMGNDSVRLGRIGSGDMSALAEPLVGREKYVEQANAYWRSAAEGKVR